VNNYTAKLTKADSKLQKDVRTTEQPLKEGATDGDYRIVYTDDEHPRLNVSVVINGAYTFKKVPVVYKQPLEAGKSYTLSINIKEAPRAWAASNIYWDGSKLTFKGVGDPCTNDENFYQGVYFKWGSLVGISPAGSFDANSTPIYVYHNGWEETTLAEAHTNNRSGFETGSLWEHIPYGITSATNGYSSDNLASFTFVSDTKNQGDICRFIGKHDASLSGYRMPKASEFIAISGVNYYWSGSTGPLAGTIDWYKGNTTFQAVVSTVSTGQQKYGSAEGTGGYAINYGATFPAVGYRDYANNIGALYGVGSSCIYWSCSAGADETNAHRLHIASGSMDTVNDKRQFAWSVRCILDQ
jgi:hypothetical protein